MHVYCSGIGGVGIGPLAMLALDAGYEVSGSDVQNTEMVELLQKRGATIALAQTGAEIADAHTKKPIDWFIYSSALPENHPELLFAQKNGIRTSKRDDFLNELISAHKLQLIAVAGTHGKTTTTGMLVWALKQLNVPASYSIGTSLSFGPPAQYTPGSDFFIYECDEFDRNFLHFHPQLSLIPSVDYDHADTYPTIEDYNYAFLEFIGQSERTLLWQESADRLGLDDTHNIEILSEGDPGIQDIQLPGEHTRKNGWLTVQVLHQLLPQIELQEIIEAISKFPGTNRRFEKIAENIYSDYAHHPVEIAATIQAAQEINKNVVVIYQPHQNIRQHEIMNEGGYGSAFVGAQRVYWLPTYLSREYKDLPIIEAAELAASTSNQAHVQTALLDNSLANHIKQHQAEGALIIAMSAGDLDVWLRQQFSS